MPPVVWSNLRGMDAIGTTPGDFSAGMRTKSTADGMFKDVNVTKSRQMDTTSI